SSFAPSTGRIGASLVVKRRSRTRGLRSRARRRFLSCLYAHSLLERGFSLPVANGSVEPFLCISDYAADGASHAVVINLRHADDDREKHGPSDLGVPDPAAIPGLFGTRHSRAKSYRGKPHDHILLVGSVRVFLLNARAANSTFACRGHRWKGSCVSRTRGPFLPSRGRGPGDRPNALHRNPYSHSGNLGG